MTPSLRRAEEAVVEAAMACHIINGKPDHSICPECDALMRLLTLRASQAGEPWPRCVRCGRGPLVHPDMSCGSFQPTPPAEEAKP